MSGNGARRHRANISGLQWARELEEALDRIGDECPENWRLVAEARIADPETSWRAIGPAVGLTNTGALQAAAGLLRLAGMEHGAAVGANGMDAEAAGRRKERRAAEPYGASTGYCRQCRYLVTAPGHKAACGGGAA